MLNKLEVIILAAGKGSRMRSTLPKVLHTLAGRPLLQHVIERALQLESQKTHVVYGHGGEAVPAALDQFAIDWVEQSEQLGTGHAVEQVMPYVDDHATVLVLYGDVPLIELDTLQQLIAMSDDSKLSLLTLKLENPQGYGRIVRNQNGAIEAIVEEKDANDLQRTICEVNSGIMALPAKQLRGWLSRLESNNAQGEFYLTDVIAMAVADGVEVSGLITEDSYQVAGINTRSQLATLERHYQLKQAEKLMEQGVTLLDPARIDIRGEIGREINVAADVTIDINVILEGHIDIAGGCTVGANCLLRNARLGRGVTIEAMSHIEDATIDEECSVGPYARLRPGTHMHPHAKVGNFVEVKKSEIGESSKVSHLSYIGDTTMGRNVNIGAGTITCNYDGVNKHQTIIGDNAFIGSDSQLIAPVTVGAGATIGAGSSISRDAPDEQLTLTRTQQKSIKWRRPAKGKPSKDKS
ncbi:MAG: bifunctional UDP-N-acetylglucosamine diphosphorylase/glucosamine-1-phosphate N-acetyltransferase GlmU [Gammaproteobacteria bacterium]|nr:bifunctional UDP-N-acetylglucosamine diphosphorylase/glucosamine-1-phosphate N-acetyltransferase GlmU [Gammaproteobacteria bacterium]